jgi:hypothetical protein
MQTDKIDSSKDYKNWIDILLDTVIADGRHRIIDLILAPYLINVKGLSTEQAIQILTDWIGRCESYEATRGDIATYIMRACYSADRAKRKPKDLSWFKENYVQLYRMLHGVAEACGLHVTDR